MQNVIEGGLNPEYPARVAMIRVGGTDATGYVEFWDKNGTIVPHSDAAGVALITISSTARSMAQFLYNASKNTSMTVPGIPDGAVGGVFRLVSGAVAVNLSGSLAGATSGGTGLDTTLAAPTANSPRQTSVSGTLIYFGQYRSGQVV